MGYVNTAYYIEHFEEIVLSMKQLPCSSIYYDEKDDDEAKEEALDMIQSMIERNKKELFWLEKFKRMIKKDWD